MSRTTGAVPVVLLLVAVLAAGAAAARPLAVAIGGRAVGPPTGPSVLLVQGRGSIGRLDLVARIQAELTRRGYAIGPIDGVPDQHTLAAIRAYQQSRGLAPDGRPTEDLFRIMQRESAATGHYGQPTAPTVVPRYATPPTAASPSPPQTVADLPPARRSIAAPTVVPPTVVPPTVVSPAVAPPAVAPPAVTAEAGGGRQRSSRRTLTPPLWLGRAAAIAGPAAATDPPLAAPAAAEPAASPVRRAQTPRSFVPRRRLVELIQIYLARKGYSVGVVDGLYGRRTAAAIRAYQQDNDLPPDGLATIRLYNGMQKDALEEEEPPSPASAATPSVATQNLLPPPEPPPLPTPIPAAEPPRPSDIMLEDTVPADPDSVDAGQEDAGQEDTGQEDAGPQKATAAARWPVPERVDLPPAPIDSEAIDSEAIAAPAADTPMPTSDPAGAAFNVAVPDRPPPSGAQPTGNSAGDVRPVPSSAAPSAHPRSDATDPATVPPPPPPPPDDNRAIQTQKELQSVPIPPSEPATLIEPPPMSDPLPPPRSRALPQSVIETVQPSAPDDPVASPSGLPFSVSVEAPPPPRSDTALRIAGTTWRLTDDNGARQIMTFETDGSISGTAFDAFVTWRQFGDNIQIQYDNGFGRAVYREGRFDDGVLTGEGRSDTGARWRWKAERLTSQR